MILFHGDNLMEAVHFDRWMIIVITVHAVEQQHPSPG